MSGESAHEHTLRTRHATTESINQPWTCEDCPERAAFYDLRVPRNDAPCPECFPWRPDARERYRCERHKAVEQ